jgi:trimeric autotransporter adhesin
MKISFLSTFGLLLGLSLFSCQIEDTANNSTVVAIQFDGNTVTVDNPLASKGVSVSINGADVVVKSVYDNENVQYKLSGTTDDGMFKVYSAVSFHLVLDGVSLTNADGPAINVQSRKGTYVTVKDGTENELTDGAVYPIEILVDEVLEEQSATFFSEGKLVFTGNGSLNVFGNGSEQHAIGSDDNILMDSVNLIIVSSAKDGIHCNDGYVQRGGSVNITAHGDGIDATTSYVDISGGSIVVQCDSIDVDGISCDSTLSVTGGNIDIVLTGNQSKGLKSEQAITLKGGVINILASGGVVLSALDAGFDPSYCSGIKSTTSVVLDGAVVSIVHTGISGKGISTGTDFTMISGLLTIETHGNGGLYKNSLGLADAYSAACISSNRTITILGGSLHATSTGMGGKGLSADGVITLGSLGNTPEIVVTTSGTSVMNGSASVTEPKAVKSDGNIYLVSGTISINAAGTGEGIDSKASIYMSGGNVIVQGPTAGTLTKAIDYVTVFSLSGGMLMACGPYRSKIPLPSTASTQNYLYATLNNTSYTLAASTLFHVQDSGGNGLVTFMPLRNAYFFLFSSPALTKDSTYSIYTGGTSTGTEMNGFFSGGVYSGGTQKKSFIPVSTKTTATFAN